MDTRLSAAGTSTLDSGAYTDLNRLNQFKVGGDSEQNIRKVAQEFESLFLNEMLKTMRSANEVFGEGNFMNSNEAKTYQEMYDQQLSVTMAGNKNGIGLADVMARQMSKMRNVSERPNPFAQVDAPVPAAPSKPLARNGETTAIAPVEKSQGSADNERNDMALLNQRRLSLPGKLAQRIQAGIVPGAEAVTAATAAGTPAGEAVGKPLVKGDWLPAKAYAAPAERSLNINGSEEVASRTTFKSAKEFMETMLPMAEKAAAKLGVDPRYLVAQAALETGWGKSIIKQGDGSSSHNLFGIKTHNSWSGDSARVMTTEYQNGKPVKEAASFRAYESFAHSFEDYVSFLQNNGRYEKALGSTANPEQFARELQKAGYATDPQYARKVTQIARKVGAYQSVQMLASVDTGNKRI
ncbi:flagellar assembly peptidoglycan hydrolase FlgJ [Pseudomonas daroniae]|uniref:Peptidoglycan hydrolase FlgJ n=1 Tax=Phytopseudomonas daroniae TaxID=2487519 RepID=A0A4Q9QR31_9GAMM|nr:MULTISPECIES: flagellar assembly peptidoglycan hydrolase FlgJ [Pseudomonas]TBU83382.1 flagellar assembly peptidoglycan hydrolase FlgJ [Pseudomonas daroniae]TBU85021.1 flagellar assembly peptidoglycan hydrolase FlgJ [Pseudomonas sp. FRB 228]TBU93686.1 flagellar assembly peptidoglycan hydrolase FlgJ [Pseudomonas daroniae]